MCPIEQTCYACQQDEHADCDGWALSYPPGACKGFPSHVPCSCASASERYSRFTAGSPLPLPEHPGARPLFALGSFR